MKCILNFKCTKDTIIVKVAVIAEWIALRSHILQPQVQIPSTPSMVISIYIWIMMEKNEKNENKQKEAEIGR